MTATEGLSDPIPPQGPGQIPGEPALRSVYNSLSALNTLLNVNYTRI